jgi:hypothetical protein
LAENRERIAAKESAKGFLLSLTVLCLVGGAVWFGYAQIFTKGLERLPSKVCERAVERDVVIRTLPSTRTADESAERQGEGEDSEFHCRIYTSADSILSGMARVQNASPKAWLDHYGVYAGSDTVRASADGVEALAQLDSDSGRSSVYVPCVPREIKAGDASETYAIITEADVVGEGRVSGTALRQAVTDFAYQLTKHVYEVAECQDPRDFPEELPRYEDN